MFRLSAFLCAISLVAANTAVALGETQEEALDRISNVFNANRDRLNSFSCEFEVTQGMVAEAEDGWRERFTPVRIQDGSLIMSRGDRRVELKCRGGEKTLADLAPPPDAKGDSAFTSTNCLSQAEMYSPKLNMLVVYGPTLGVINFAEGIPFQIVETPLSMGIMGSGDQFSPVGFIQGAKQGKLTCKYVGSETIDGIKVEVLECGVKPLIDADYRIMWYLDLERGAIPVRKAIYTTDGSLYGETKTLGIKQLKNDAWVCEKCITLYTGDTGRYSVFTMILRKIDLREPDRKELGFDLPAGWKVIDTKDMRSRIKLTKPERLLLDDVPSWIKRCNEQLMKVTERQNALRK